MGLEYRRLGGDKEMKVRGFPIITRHAPKGAEVESPKLEDSDSNDIIVLTVFQSDDAPTSPLPADHPLAIRYRESRPRIVTVADWKQAIQVGGTELAVA